jgi:ADP-ribose pyrophosphatase YjhB (NUDIX family)
MKDNAIELIVRGVCVRNRQVLLCHGKGADNTYLPGGHIEPGESATAALTRELREELGQASVPGRFLGAVEHTFVQRGTRRYELNLVFAVTIPRLSVDDDPRSMESRIEFLWVDLESLSHARLEPAMLVPRLGEWLNDPHTQACWASNYGPDR